MKRRLIKDLKIILIITGICVFIKSFYIINYNYEYEYLKDTEDKIAYIIYTDRSDESLYYKGISSMVENKKSDELVKEIITSSDYEDNLSKNIIWNALEHYSEQEKQKIAFYAWSGIDRQDEIGVQLMEKLTIEEYSAILFAFDLITSNMTDEYNNAFGSSGLFYYSFMSRYL